ncbi:MAG: M16 family metallopeptidase [Croceibacterium sp.]
MTSFDFRNLRAVSRAAVTAVLLATSLAPAALAQDAPATTQQAAQAGIPAWSIASSDLPADPTVRFGQLDNGMRYAIKHHETPKGAAAIRFAFDVGVREEEEGEIGLAHFVEHMAFNGSKNIPEGELVRKLERLGLAFGADTNAETGAEHTTYKLDLPRTDDETVDAALEIMRETASNLTIDPAAVDREKGIIQSEARVRNVPQRRRASEMLATVLPGNRLGHRISITPEQIGETTAEGLRRFYEGYYRPDYATLVIVGDFDAAEMERKVRARFADWRPTGEAREQHAPPVASGSVPLIGAFADPSIPEIIELTRVSTYTPPANSAVEERRDLLLSIASFALTTRFAAISREADAPILAGQAASTDLYRSADSFGVLVVAKDGEWRRALAVGEQELRRAYEHGFTGSEIAEAKANIATQLTNAVTQNAGKPSAAIAEELATASLYDRVPMAPETYLALYQAVEPTLTAEEIHAAFREAWEGAPTGIHVATKQPIPEAPQTIAAALGESAQVAVAAPVEAETAAFAYTDFGPAGEVVFDERIEDLGIRTVRFANGVQLNLKKTDFEPGKVAFRMAVGEGTSAFPRDRQGLPFMVNMVTGIDGLEAHGVDELRRILAGREVGYGLTNAGGALLAQGGTTAADLEMQMQVLAAQLTAPGYRPETQAQWAATVPVLAQNFKADPGQIIGLALNYLLAGNDPRFGLDDPAKLSELTVDDLKAVLEPQLGSGAIALGLVGDFDEAAAISAVATTLGALPARAARSGDVPDAEATFANGREPRVLRHAGTADQGYISLSWPTTDESELRPTMVRSLLSAVYQLRLLDEIREKLGATYTPNAFSFASDAYAGFGHLTAVAPAEPAQMDLVAQTMKTIAAEFAASPPDADEVLRARNPMLEQYQRQERQNGAWTAVVAEAQSDPAGLDRRRERRAILEAITPEELQAAAREWLSGQPLEIRVLPTE